MLGGKASLAVARKPQIMSDAAYVILTSKANMTTDNFFLDDEVLISEGATLGDLEKYKPDPTTPNHMLMPDGMC